MRRVISMVLFALVALAGCASPGTPPRTSEQPRTAPYSGPMRAESSSADGASAARASGAAGLALECDGRAYLGGRGDYARPGDATLPDGGLDQVAASADTAFTDWVDQLWGLTPTSGYRVERDDGDRQLRSFDAGGRSRVAVIMAGDLRDYTGRTGWGVDTWAQCDPAEFPVAVTDRLGIEVAVDGQGDRVPTTLVTVFTGSEHCDWQDTTFLELFDPAHPGDGARPGPRLAGYVRDAAGHFPDLLTTTFTARTALPAGAHDTGYRLRGRQLWTANAPLAAYLVEPGHPDDAERWPAAGQRIGCA